MFTQLTVLTARDFHLANTFIQGVSTGSQRCVPSITTKHAIYQFETGAEVLLIEGSDMAEDLLASCEFSLIVSISESEEVLTRVKQSGGMVVEECCVNSSALHVITGPGGITLRLIALSGTSTAAEVLLTWKLSKGDTSTLKETANPTNETDNTSWSPPSGPLIRTLFPSLLHRGSLRPIYPNSSVPIPFKTDLFEGEMLLLIRTTPLSPEYRHFFEGSDACFEVQVQGRFLRRPTGKLFIGAEITKKMNLGFITRGICSSILQFVRSVNPYIHTSFGDAEGRELPHITGPLWCMADRIVVTPAGETPPKLGYVLPENERNRAIRRANPLHEEIVDLDAIYSFSTNTENIELCDWSMVNVPLMKKFDLHTFWADADIRLCSYCVPFDSTSGPDPSTNTFPKYHYQDRIEYMLCVEIEHQSNHPDRGANTGPLIRAESISRNSPLSLANVSRSELARDNTFLAFSHDTGDMDIHRGIRLDDDESIYSDVFFDTDDGFRGGVDCLQNAERSATPVLSPTKLYASVVDYSDSGLVFVPSVVSVDDLRRTVIGMRRDLYVISIPKTFLRRSEKTNAQPSVDNPHSSYLTTLCSFKEFEACFSVYVAPRLCSVDRMSITEKRRLDLQESVAHLCALAISDDNAYQGLLSFMEKQSHSATFLSSSKANRNSGVGSTRLRSDLEDPTRQSFVCVRQGQTHWSEEYMVLTSSEIVFVKHSARFGRMSRLRLSLRDIQDVALMDSRYWPMILEGCFFMTLSSFSREYTVMIRGHGVAMDWVNAIVATKKKVKAVGTKAKDSILRQPELFMQSMDWNLGDRVILNCRVLCGRLNSERPHIDAVLDRNSSEFPLQLVQHALEEISHICVAATNDRNELLDQASWPRDLQNQLVHFLTLVSYLPCIDLKAYTYSETEYTCLFVNLYHVIVLHAFLVAGPPSSVLKWPSFFNSCAYEAFGDIFSLSELEHCIIKNGIGAPKSFLIQALIPQSVYDLKLTQSDPRLLWALNCGSLSMPATVPILNPKQCEEQLDDIMKKSLDAQLMVYRYGTGLVVMLPQVCQWYSNVLERQGSKPGTAAMLKFIERYASGDKAAALRELHEKKAKSYTIKYNGLDYRCRIFKAYS